MDDLSHLVSAHSSQEMLFLIVQWKLEHLLRDYDICAGWWHSWS